MQRRARADLSDVARAAGVSRSTASRALRGEGRVSAETVARVARVAADLGYVRDLRAAELRETAATTLGLLVRGAERSFYGEVAAQVQAAADARDIDLLIVNGGDDHDGQFRAVQALLGHRVAGMMIASGRMSLAAAEHAATFVPTVLIGMPSSHPEIDSVAIDPMLETQLAASVARAGHRRVAVTTSDRPESTTLHLRTARFRDELIARGADPVLVPGVGEDGQEFVTALRRAVDGGATAVMAGDDPTAVQVLELLDAWGMNCPGQISVTGFDGVGVYASPLFGLTTVRQPVEQLAAAAMRVMVARLGGRVSAVSHDVLPGELLIGRTLGKPAGHGD
ncbi:LacI family DNA-binding transcriptional regulator [Cellulomonas sp. NPDC089187]|uniref:LacI family DNA-binding transcriptional regulator n=1 Tax=Cellulomonas sp. NPDC089187 TaxID=3154970 RepID=UPI003444831F